MIKLQDKFNARRKSIILAKRNHPSAHKTDQFSSQTSQTLKTLNSSKPWHQSMNNESLKTTQNFIPNLPKRNQSKHDPKQEAFINLNIE